MRDVADDAARLRIRCKHVLWSRCIFSVAKSYVADKWQGVMSNAHNDKTRDPEKPRVVEKTV